MVIQRDIQTEKLRNRKREVEMKMALLAMMRTYHEYHPTQIVTRYVKSLV